MRRLISVWVLSALCAVVFADRTTWVSRAETIAPSDLRAHLEFIASDALEGRDTPSKGLDLAGMYIVSHLQRWGLKPAGENGTYFQTLTYRTDTLVPEESLVQVAGQTLRFGQGFIARPVALDVTASLVYVGNGWSNPEGVDPYEGLEVEGKILVVQRGFPKEVQTLGLERAEQAGWISPERNAQLHGAIAILRVDPSDMERMERLARFWSQRRRLTELEPTSVPMIVVARPVLEALFEGERLSAQELLQRAENNEPAPAFALSPSKTMRIKLSVQTKTETARSVLAIADGSDPVLKNEYVSIGAHLDHVGVGRADSKGDTIYNGADDNGSGVVALMEIAEALGTGPRPKRSVLFLWYAGEEKGLLGSRLFVERPTVPLENIIVNINLDMVGRSRTPDDTKPQNRLLSAEDEVYVIGPRVASPDLGAKLEQVNNGYLRLKLNSLYDDKNHPEQLFYRSDQLSFIMKGIPALFFFTGLHEDYHRPSDEVSKIDFEKMARIARTVFGLVWELAEAPERPARIQVPL